MPDTHPVPAPSRFPWTDPEAFADSVQQASRRLFGGAELHARLTEAMRRLVLDCQRLRERGQSQVPAIVLVGGVGEGKS